jgi:hypothetical protein
MMAITNKKVKESEILLLNLNTQVFHLNSFYFGILEFFKNIPLPKRGKIHQ